jgi:hypothetical protein
MANTLLSNGFLWMTPTIALKFYPASRVPRDADTIAINAGVRKVTWPDVHGRPLFAKLSFRNGLKVKIAPVHPDFHYETCSLSLMGSAGQRLNRLHAL